MIEHRLKFAKQYLDDAHVLLRMDKANSAVSRAYYASYQAMWAALGDPPRGAWKHLAIIRHFVRGYWFVSDHDRTGPGLLENLRLPLRRLYSYRIRSDYDAEEIGVHFVSQFLDTVRELIETIEEKDCDSNGTD